MLDKCKIDVMTKKKILAVLQMFLGGLAAVDAGFLGYYKAFIPPVRPPGQIWVDAMPPDAIMEYFLLGCGVLILALALWQAKKHFRYSGWQTIFGGILTAGAAYFTIRAATRGSGERSALYFAVYALLALGAAVFITGLIQLITSLRTHR
jgi:hypothetical protein